MISYHGKSMKFVKKIPYIYKIKNNYYFWIVFLHIQINNIQLSFFIFKIHS